MNLGGLNMPETTINTPIKVHCDASRNHETGISSAGWVFSDHNGKPLNANGCNLGTSFSINQAERESIKRAIDVLNSYNQVQHLKVYTDSKTAVTKLDHDELCNGNFESVTIEWVSREDNPIADTMARHAMQDQVRRSEPKYSICD